MGRAQRFQVTVEGQEHDVRVELNDAGEPARVLVDGTPCPVRLGADDAMVVRPAGDGGPQHVVHLPPGRRPTQASVGGQMVEVDVKTAQEAALAAALAAAGGGSGSGAVKAPMPGRVVRVLVSEGDAVEVDAPLLIVEAMKMENEVQATTAGVITQVAVAAGDTVDAGQLLCEVGPAPES